MDAITIHNYHGETFLYLGSSSIPPRPEGVGLPAGCTTVPPPADIPQGCRARWSGQGWDIAAVPLPEGPPALGLEALRAARQAEAQSQCTMRLRAGYPLRFAGQGYHMQADRPRLTALLASCQARQTLRGAGAGVSLRTEEGAVLEIPAGELAPLLVAALDYQDAVSQACWAHKDALAGLTTPEAVRNHDLSEGWPPPPLYVIEDKTLDQAKAQAIREVREHAERIRAAYYPTGKELDIRRQAPGYAPADLATLDGFIDTTLNVTASQAALEIQGAATLEALTAIMDGYREMYASEGA